MQRGRSECEGRAKCLPHGPPSHGIPEECDSWRMMRMGKKKGDRGAVPLVGLAMGRLWPVGA